MARWGSCDFSQLRQLQRQIEALRRDQDKFCEECAKYLAQRLLEEVKKRTPVKTGELRRNWTIGIRQEGNNYEIELINETGYASYVEYGHRTPGHTGWVDGKFMMTIAEREIQEQAPAMLERKLADLLRRSLNAD